jgi:Ras-related GTP-binding protein C/D
VVVSLLIYNDSQADLVENYAEIQRAMQEELEDFPYPTLSQYAPNINFEDPSTSSSIIAQLSSEIRFDMTSVHDVSLRDAWSKIIQGIMEMLPSIEALLLNFTEVSEQVVIKK